MSVKKAYLDFKNWILLISKNWSREEIKKKAEKFAKQYDLLFFETSALTGEGIDEVFLNLPFENLTFSP